jgi:hypothetical protein
MVCVILIARPKGDPRIDISTELLVEASGEVEADVTTAHVPAQAGANMGSTFERDFGLGYVPKTPFIYGFRVRECFLKKEVDTSKAYYKDAKMHDQAETSDTDESKLTNVDESFFIPSGIAKIDLAHEALGDMEHDFDEISITDDNDCACSLLVSKTR